MWLVFSEFSFSASLSVGVSLSLSGLLLNTAPNEDSNEPLCRMCGDGGEIICCDTCPASYHPVSRIQKQFKNLELWHHRNVWIWKWSRTKHGVVQIVFGIFLIFTEFTECSRHQEKAPPMKESKKESRKREGGNQNYKNPRDAKQPLQRPTLRQHFSQWSVWETKVKTKALLQLHLQKRIIELPFALLLGGGIVVWKFPVMQGICLSNQ